MASLLRFCAEMLIFIATITIIFGSMTNNGMMGGKRETEWKEDALLLQQRYK